MKKLILLIAFLVSCFSTMNLNAGEFIARYNLYPTTNIFNFLKLDTRTGEIWQVQWNTDSANRMTVVLSSEKLSNDTQNGRFELIPTTNIHTFLLLDKIDGSVWQVQWSIEKEERLIVPIKELSSL